MHIFDKNGLEIERRSNLHTEDPRRIYYPLIYRYTYDKYGNVLSTYFTIDEIVIEDSIYKYRYDEFGNWIFRQKIDRGTTTVTDFRKIDYYPD